MLDFSARDRNNYVEIPVGVEQDLPAGISLELVLTEIRHALKNTAFPFSTRADGFDLPLDEALAVVRLSEEGYPDSAAWWLAREASVTNCLDEIDEPTD